MADSPDFGDLVAQGILEGFRGISPYMAHLQKMQMMKEDTAFNRMMQEENLALAQAQNARAERADTRSAALQDLQMRITQQEADAAKEQRDYEIGLRPKAEELTDAEIAAAKARARASTAEAEVAEGTVEDRIAAAGFETSKLSLDVEAQDLRNQATLIELERLKEATRLETDYRDKREQALTTYRGFLDGFNLPNEKELLTWYDALAANPEFNPNQIMEMTEAKMRKLAAPGIIQAISEGKTPFKKEFAAYLGMQYELNGTVSMEDAQGWLRMDDDASRRLALGVLENYATAAAASGELEVKDILDTVIGGWMATSSALDASKPNYFKDLFPKYTGSGDPSQAKEAPQTGARIGATLGAQPADVKESGAVSMASKGNMAEMVGKAAPSEMDRAVKYQEMFTPQILAEAATQPPEWQDVTAYTLSENSQLGVFSSAYAALAPGSLGGGSVDERVSMLVSGDWGGARLATPDTYRDAQSALVFAEWVKSKRGDVDRDVVNKMAAVFRGLVDRNKVGDPAAEKAALNAIEQFIRNRERKASGRD